MSESSVQEDATRTLEQAEAESVETAESKEQSTRAKLGSFL